MKLHSKSRWSKTSVALVALVAVVAFGAVLAYAAGPASVTASFDPASPGVYGWYTTSVPAYAVHASDPRGIGQVQAQIDGTATPVTISNDTTIGVGSPAGLPKLSEGTHTLYFRASDIDGVFSVWQSETFKVDLTDPNQPSTPTAKLIDGGKIAVSGIAAVDPDPATGKASGVSTYTVAWGATSTFTLDPAKSVDVTSGVSSTNIGPLADGKYYVRVLAADAAGNVSVLSTASAGITVDNDKPVVSVAVSSSVWTTNSVTTTITATDTNSGIDKVVYKFYPANSRDGVSFQTTPTVTTTVTAAAGTTQSVITTAVPEGAYKVEAVAYDVAGNVSDPVAATSKWDKSTPVTTVDGVNPSSPDGANNTYLSVPTVSLKSTDAAVGAKLTVKYAWGNAALADIDATSGVAVAVPADPSSADGTHTLTYFAVDGSGNTEATKTVSFKVIANQPVTTIALNQAANGAGWINKDTTATITATTSPDGKAIQTIFYKVDSSAYATYSVGATGFPVPEGVHTITAYAVDASGTPGLEKTLSYKLDKTKPVVGVFTPSVVSSASSTVTVAVAEAGSGIASGSMNLVLTDETKDAVVTTGALNAKFTAPLVLGDNLVSVTAIDVAGNVSDTVFRVVQYQVPATNFTLTYAAGANGTITGATSQTVAAGANGTLVTAVPNAGFHFLKWSDGVLTAARADANVSANLSVTAVFEADAVTPTYTLSYVAGANGTISGNAAQTVLSGANGTLVTAVPNTGFHFVKWSDGVLTAARSDANVSANLSVTAVFEADVIVPSTFTVIGTAGANGTLSISGATVVGAGSNLTVMVAPNAGYKIADVVVDGVSKGAVSSVTLTNIGADHTISASFSWIKLKTTATCSLSAKTVRLNHYVTVSGKLTGGTFSGQTFQIQYRRSTSSKYSVFKTLKVNSSGSASYRLKATRRGTYYYRIVFLGDSKFLAAPIKAGIKLVVK